jgi:hypothetical protein
MILGILYRCTFSASKEEKEEALMHIQNIVILLNRLASLSLPDEENDLSNQMTGEISSNNLIDDYLMVHQPTE